MIIKRYGVFFITQGEYSDYRVSGIFRAMRDIDTETELAEFVASLPEDDTWYTRSDKFIAWLLEKRILVELDNDEWALPWF